MNDAATIIATAKAIRYAHRAGGIYTADAGARHAAADAKADARYLTALELGCRAAAADRQAALAAAGAHTALGGEQFWRGAAAAYRELAAAVRA